MITYCIKLKEIWNDANLNKESHCTIEINCKNNLQMVNLLIVPKKSPETKPFKILLKTDKKA